MSSRGIATFLVKLVLACALGYVLFLAVALVATTTGATECSSDCSLLSDVFTGDAPWFFLAACVLVVAGAAWGIPRALRRHKPNRHADSTR